MATYPQYLGRFRFQDSMGVRDHVRDELEQRQRLAEQQYNSGNAVYVLSLPAGNYEAEDAGDTMNIYAVGDNASDRELITSVPSGTYKIENDEAGAHLYRMPDDEAERMPLSASPLGFSAGRDSGHPAALARMNDRMHEHYKTAPDATRYVTHRDMTESMSNSTARAGLANLNLLNQRFWRGK